MAQQATININLNSKQAQGNLDNLTGSINSAGGSAASLRLELRKTITELQNLEPGSARFRELSLRAGELRDQIADTNAVVGQLAGNVAERLTRGISGVVSVGVAGFQTIAASAALFGAESEELTQTLVKLNALMNLSQAIETFAGLDQKIVEIRAAFQSLTTSTVAQTVATEGQAVANVAATTTTTALGVAMKALPIIAIVAGLGTLVYGLYQYATANSEATQKEKEAAKQREILEKRTKALEKAQDEDRKQVAASSVEYFNLIQRLKETNAGSKERDKLIKQINTEYGTTLQNLKDETAFQSQLNLSVKEYIALQVLKVKQESNKKNEEKAINNLVKAQQNLNKFQKEYAGMTEKEISDYDIRNYGVSVYRDTLIKLNGELDNAQKRAENYAITNGKLQKEIDKLQVDFPDLTNKTKDNTNSTKDATDAADKYADALEKIKEELDRQQAAEEGLKQIKDERTSRTSAQISEELKLIQDFDKQQEELIKVATNREIEALDEKFKQGLVNEEEYKKGRIEIQEGGLNNLLQVETDLLNGKRLLLAEDLENVKDKYELEGQITQQAIKQIQDETRLLDIQFQKAQELDAIENSTLTEEKKQEAILAVKKKYLDEEVKLIEQSGQNQIDALGLQKEKQLSDEQLTADQRKQIEEKYNQDVLQISQTTQSQIQDAINGTKDVQKTATEEFQDQIEKIQEYLDLITGLYNQFSDTVSMISQSRTKQREAEIEGLYAFEREALENQLAEGLVSREQYDNKLLELDQQREQEQLAIARKEFETNKKLNMANAVINGAQAVLQALASSPPPLSFILAALVGGLAAVQFGVISSEEFTAAGGGIVPGTGSGMIDSVPAMLAPGETVINAQSSAMYPELLNQVNMAGGGISLKPDLPAVNKSNGDTRVFGDNKVDKPIRAYVVETDVTDTQKRVDRIKRSAEF
jgi:hypothetical protein